MVRDYGATVSERNHVRTLNPYSRMALALRGWGLEAVVALGLLLTWRAAVGLDGEGLGVLVFGLVVLALWRCTPLRRRLRASCHIGHANDLQLIFPYLS